MTTDVTVDVHLAPDAAARALEADVRAGLACDAEDAAAEVVLRRPGQRAVRRDHPAPRVLPDPHRALDPGRARARHRRASPRRDTLVELGSGTSEKTRLLLDALARRRARCERFVPFDVSEQTLRDAAAAVAARVPGVARARGRRRLRAPPRRRCPAADARLVAFLGEHHRQPRARAAGAVPRRARGRAGARRRVAARHRPGEGRRPARRRLRRRRRRDRRVQPQRAARARTASSTPTSTPTPSTTSPVWDADEEWIEMRLRSTARRRPCTSPPSISTSSSRPARRCAPRSAPSSAARGSSESSRPPGSSSPSGGPTPPATSRCRSRSSADRQPQRTTYGGRRHPTWARRRPAPSPADPSSTGPNRRAPGGAAAVAAPGGTRRPRWSTRHARVSGCRGASERPARRRGRSGRDRDVPRRRRAHVGAANAKKPSAGTYAHPEPSENRTAAPSSPRTRNATWNVGTTTLGRTTRPSSSDGGTRRSPCTRATTGRASRRRCRPSAPGTPRTRCRSPVSSARSTSGWKPTENRSRAGMRRSSRSQVRARGRRFRGCRRRWSRHHPDHQQHEEARDVRLIVRTTHDDQAALPRSARHPPRAGTSRLRGCRTTPCAEDEVRRFLTARPPVRRPGHDARRRSPPRGTGLVRGRRGRHDRAHHR